MTDRVSDTINDNSNMSFGNQDDMVLVTPTEPEKRRVAGFWVRTMAYLFDLICISAVASMSIAFWGLAMPLPESLIAWIGTGIATVGLVGFIYFSVMTKLFAQTLGKMFWGIEVVRQDGQELDWMTVVFREVIGRTISQLSGSHIGYLWVAFHPYKSGWHDMIGDTRVVWVREVEESRWV